MDAANGYLLDTNIVLHATRDRSPVAMAVDERYGLRSSPFRPAICEVTVAELWAFAESWGDKRKELLRRVIGDFLVLPIGDARIHHRWAKLYSHAKASGLAIQQDHNDVWIAATAQVAGMRLLTTDGSAFLPLRGTSWVDVDVLDPKTGINLP